MAAFIPAILGAVAGGAATSTVGGALAGAVVGNVLGNKKDDKPKAAPAAPAATPPPPPPPPVEPPKPPEPPKPITPVKPVKEEIIKEPEKAGPGEGAAAPTKPDVGAGTTTAIGGQEEAETLEKIAEGPAEKDVAKTVRKGRRATIATTSQGLLTQAPTRRRRSLMGGLLS